MSVLSTAQAATRPDPTKLLTYVSGHGGPGPYRQFLQILSLYFRPGKFRAPDYYEFGLWRPGLTAQARREFVSQAATSAFNLSFMKHGAPSQFDLLEDKLAATDLFARAGFKVVENLAAYGSGIDFDGVETLADRDDVIRFLHRRELYPLFGKPRTAVQARGAAWFESLSDDARTITLGNGVEVPVQAVADEVVRDWGDGYLFQPKLDNAAMLRRHGGKAMSGLRIITLNTDDGVVPVCAVQRLPSVTAMHDAASVNQRVFAAVDMKTGQVTRVRPLGQPASEDLTYWQDPETPLLGATIPFVAEAVAMSVAAHALAPAHGILGWDIFITDDGPVLNEVNPNPGPLPYQAAYLRGFKNPDIMPLLERCRAWATRAA